MFQTFLVLSLLICASTANHDAPLFTDRNRSLANVNKYYIDDAIAGKIPFASEKEAVGDLKRQIFTCPFLEIGIKHDCDKVWGWQKGIPTYHAYYNIYCEMLMHYRHAQIGRKVRMLEIGFGCAQTNAGASALLWKEFFSFHDGPGLNLFEVDYYGSEPCAEKFMAAHPNIVDGFFVGDQADAVFLDKVVQLSGGMYDIIIDDGSHESRPTLISFQTLWKHVIPGGLYIVEDLQVSNSRDAFVQVILGWMDYLVTTKTEGNQWYHWPYALEPDMLSVNCYAEVCAFRKKYLTEAH
jgi:hypothetical protein